MTTTVYRDQLATDVDTLRDLLTVHHANAPIFGLSWLEIRELTGWTWPRIDLVVESACDRRRACHDHACRTVYLHGGTR